MTGPAFMDLHCHTGHSYDCLSSLRSVVRAASDRGLTHLAITDHDRIDGALEARAMAPAGLTVIVGEEIKTRDGDLICLFLHEAIPPGLSAAETIAAARAQGGLVGIPHPFDSIRGSMREGSPMASLWSSVDWIETYNARLIGRGNDRAARFALDHGLPGVAVSDAHSVIEVAVAYTRFEGDPSTPAGLLASLAGAQLVPGRATFVVRGWTPMAKVIQRLRGNGQLRPSPPAAGGPRELQ